MFVCRGETRSQSHLWVVVGAQTTAWKDKKKEKKEEAIGAVSAAWVQKQHVTCEQEPLCLR